MLRIAIIFLAASPALAGPEPAGTAPDCYCTDRNGNRVELGQRICLYVDGRVFTAQCQMSLNVPMWRDVGDGCPSSSRRLSPAPDDPANG